MNEFKDETPPQKVIIPRGFMEHKDFETYFWKWYGFLVPDRESIQLIKEYVGGDAILEIGSGTGLWAKLLQNNDVKIIATDLLPPIYKLNWYRRSWTDVEELDGIEAVKKYNDRKTLMLIWPHDDNVWVDAVKEFKGNKLIYGGNSGPKKLSEHFEKEWDIEVSKKLNFFPTNNHEEEFGQPVLYLMKRKER
jgi:hypothetical protein